MADPLHFGDFGGIATKLIWFLFGLTMTGLAVSGVTIYALRLARDRPTPRSGPTQGRAAAANLWTIAWSGMGVWRWPALGAIGVGLAMMIPLLAGLR